MRNVSVNGTQMNPLHRTTCSRCIQVSLTHSNRNLPIQKSTINVWPLWRSFQNSINPCKVKSIPAKSYEYRNNQFGVPSLESHRECSCYRTLKSWHKFGRGYYSKQGRKLHHVRNTMELKIRLTRVTFTLPLANMSLKS